MNITVYTMCYNEESILPFFLNHYSKFATEIIIYDNKSTDRTVEIAKANSLVTEINTIDTKNSIDDRVLTNFKNTCWKNSTSDFVIVVDVDELLYHPDMINFLTENHDYPMFRPHGYNMIGETFPDVNFSITSQIKTGVRTEWFDKQCIFNPKLLKDVNYDHGAHTCNPSYVDNINFKQPYFKSDLKLLHYKYLSLDYFVQKNNMCKQRISDYNIEGRYGIEYTYDSKFHIDDFNNKLKQSKIVI